MKEDMVMLNVEPLTTPHKDAKAQAKGKTNQKTTGAKMNEKSESDLNLEDIQIR